MRKKYITPLTKTIILMTESIIAGSSDWGDENATPGGTAGTGQGDPNDELGTRQQSIWSRWEDS